MGSEDPAESAPTLVAGAARRRPRAQDGEVYARGDSLGRYIVLGRLGAGGMGEVYTAYDPELDRRIAIKVIRPAADPDAASSARGLLLGEAQALAKLAHPNVVHVYDVGTHRDDVYIAMEYVEGITLTQWLREAERSWHEVVDKLVAAGRGLEAAHAQGIVHRDVKPDNMLLGADGRPRMIDFGVAVATLGHDSDLEGSALVGTPAYMAPEQFLSEDIGPHTDQFSFGVALYEALWHKKPFAGKTVAELSDNVCAGNLEPVPDGDVPGWLRDAVVRALAVKPAERWPSMTALLAALTPAPRRFRAWPLVVVGALLALAAVVIVAVAQRGGDAACGGYERELAGVWDVQRKDALARAMRAANNGKSWPAVERVLDDYAAGWLAHKTAACRATSVTHEQTAAVLERRMACLDARRRELDATVTLLAAGGEAAARAIDTVTGIRSLGQCDNLAALGQTGPPPAAPAGEVRAAEDGLARVQALRLAAEYPDATKEIAAVLARADRLGWPALRARALVERGLVEAAGGDAKAARETLFEAIRRGAEADDVASQATAWTALVGVDVPAEAMRWAQHAEVALAKAGGDQEQQALLLHNTASALRQLGRFDEALAKEQQALALFQHALGNRHYRVALERSAIGTTYRDLGQRELAIREGEGALRLAEDVLGKDHPELAALLVNLARSYEDAERYDDARGKLARALALQEKELGPQHPDVATTLLELAGLERRAGRFDTAEQQWQRAYDIRVAAFGAGDAEVTRTLFAKLLDLAGRGLTDEALELSRTIVVRLLAQLDPAELASALGVRCELLRRTRQLDKAAEACADALAALGPTPEPMRAVYVLAYAARLEVDRKDLDRARTYADQARAALAGVHPGQRLASAFVLWAEAACAPRREDAQRLARDARAALLAEGKGRESYVAELDKLGR